MRAALLVALVLAAPAALADEQAVDPDAPSLRVETWKDGVLVVAPKVKVGEPFHVIVTATPRPDVVVSMPATFESGKFEVLERKETAAPGTTERSFDLTVVAWEPGRQTFPGVPVTYIPKGQSELKHIATAGVDVDVVAVVGDEEAELRPIAPPVAVYERDWRLVKIAGAAVGALLLAGVLALAIRSARRRRRALAAAPVVDLRPPHEIALEKLRGLETSGMLDETDRRPFYFALTEVVRDYLGRRFGFAALDMTSQELLDALAAAPEAAPVRADVEAWLGACDLVKFARVPASRAEAVSALERARGLVEASRPAPPSPSPPSPEVARG